MKFKFLPHTADIKFQAFGKTLEEVFENSALALFKSMYKKKVESKKKVKFSVEGNDLESLMYNFLEEFLYLFDAKGFIGSKVKVKIDKIKTILKAEVSGDETKKYKIEMNIKAITYNEMFVKKIKNGFMAQVVLDI